MVAEKFRLRGDVSIVLRAVRVRLERGLKLKIHC